MIKKFILYTFVFFTLFLLCYNIHEYVLLKNQIYLPFSLRKVYLFHAGFSSLVCVNFLLLSTVNNFFSQLGFLYLGVLFLKIILFCIIFYESIFSEQELLFSSRISLLIPVLIFLLTEVIFVSKILNQKE